MNAPSLDDWRAHVLDRVEAVGRALQPDGDWSPMLLMDTPEALEIVPLVGQLEEDPRLIAALVAERKARLVAMVRSAWTLQGDEARAILRDEAPRPRENPNRREAVWVYTGTAEAEHTDLAEIIRRPDAAPELGEWQSDTAAQGPTVDLLRAAMKVAAA